MYSVGTHRYLKRFTLTFSLFWSAFVAHAAQPTCLLPPSAFHQGESTCRTYESVTSLSPPFSKPPATYSLLLSYVSAGQGGAGQLESITYPSGNILSYRYNSTGQLTGLHWVGKPLVVDLVWNALGEPTRWRWPFVSGATGAHGVGLEALRTYNTAGQLIDNGIATYQWDAAGRVSRITQQLLGPAAKVGEHASTFAVDTSINYDATGRVVALTHAPYPGLPPGVLAQDVIGSLSTSYQYDANGNRSEAHYSQFGGSGGMESLHREFGLEASHNRVSSFTDTYTHKTRTYTDARMLQWDSSGRLMDDGRHLFEYDPRGRVAAINGPGGTTRYLTNALNQRVRKIEPDGRTTDTMWGDEELGLQSHVLGHYRPSATADGAPVVLAEYIWLPTASGPMPIAVSLEGQLYAVHSDHLNTPRRLTDTNGNAVWQWAITGFGELEPTATQTGFVRERVGGALPIANTKAVKFELRYPGQQHDPETGLYYNHHRYYDPYLTVGYTQADPLGLEAGWNRFRYANGNPMSFSDASGEAPILPSWKTHITRCGKCTYYINILNETMQSCKFMVENQCTSPEDTLRILNIFNAPSPSGAIFNCAMRSLPPDFLSKKTIACNNCIWGATRR